jgi:CHAT domain-containing protein/tetratricopeptide (TPR) repeat protein
VSSTTVPSVEAVIARLMRADDPDERRAIIRSLDSSPDNLHAAVLRLTDEAARIMGIDPRRMERMCEDAQSIADLSGDRFLRATARMRRGDAHRALGQSVEACHCYDEAEAIFRKLGRPVEAARTRIGWVDSASKLGHVDEALAAARGARRVLARHGDTLRVARLSKEIGILHAEQGRYRMALTAYTRALAMFRSLGPAGEVEVARSLQNRGLTLTRLGNHHAGLYDLQSALHIFTARGEHAGAARATRSIGETYMELGRYAAAARELERARVMFQGLGLNPGAVSVARDIADCYFQLNQPGEALRALDATQSDLDRVELPRAELEIAVRRVVALTMLDDPESAHAAFDRAQPALEEGRVDLGAWLALHESTALLRNGETSPAITAALEAERLAQEAGAGRLLVLALVCQASAHLAAGDPARATPIASRAALLGRRTRAAPVLQRLYELLGAVAEASGWPARARRWYSGAIEQLEREQQGVIFAFRDSFGLGRETAYERLAALELRAGAQRSSHAIAERAKSRTLADAVAGHVVLRPRGTTQARRLQRELTEAREAYALAFRDLVRQADGDRLPRGDDGAMPALAAHEKHIASIMQQLQLLSDGTLAAGLYGAVSEPSLPRLPHGSVLIEYFIAGDRILRYVISGDRVTGSELAVEVPQIERLLRTLRLNFDATERTPGGRHALTEQARTILARLSAHLLEGIDGLDEAESLIVVPHGLLHYLPFHAFVRDGAYLIERFAVSYAPSAAVYGICADRARRRQRTGTALVLGHSSGGRLRFTREESLAVGRVLGASVHLDQAATRAVLEREGRDAAVIHIAAHGRFRADAPLFSYIELEDGPLTAADVFNLDLSAALVSLSACETGRGLLGAGDELAGMARAFIYAGAGALLVTQWRVDDSVAAHLMIRFHEELRGGAGAASALRTTQAGFLADMPQSDMRHPFYWAGFQLIGADSRLPRRFQQGREEQQL